MESDNVRPLLLSRATERTGDASLPGEYSHENHLWMVDGEPIVQAKSDLAELNTKTSGVPERDDKSFEPLLELQTKTRAQIERDDESTPGL